MLWAIDTRRDPGPMGQDMLRDEPYNTLCTLATLGRIIFVGGGPNCRTWSILRWFPKPNAPTPVRGRAEDTLWGLPGLSQQELQDTDDDSILMLRQMYLTSLAYSTNKDLPTPRVTGSFLEHPRDPSECSNNPQAHKCSSIWVSQAYIRWANQLRHHRIKFDQCELGQVVTKATTLSTDLPLHHWQDMKCTHGTHKTSDDIKSSDLSRYPWAMMEGLAAAIILHLQKTLQSLATPVDPTPAPANHASEKTSNAPTPPKTARTHQAFPIRLGPSPIVPHPARYPWIPASRIPWWNFRWRSNPDPFEMEEANHLLADWPLGPPQPLQCRSSQRHPAHIGPGATPSVLAHPKRCGYVR